MLCVLWAPGALCRLVCAAWGVLGCSRVCICSCVSSAWGACLSMRVRK
jgi:hypothetical protein